MAVKLLPPVERERAYTITVCPSCHADTALVIFVGVYICAACGGTGVATPFGRANVPHDEPDDDARDAFRTLHRERHSMREFTRYCKERTKIRGV